LGKVAKCFAYGKYGHTYIKCVTNPTKVRKFKANRIEKKKDEILLGKYLGVERLVEATTSFNFSTFYEQYGSFI